HSPCNAEGAQRSGARAATCPKHSGSGGMFTSFERLLKPTDVAERSTPPPGFFAFFWHFVGPAKGLFAVLFATGLLVALLDAAVPVFIGRIVTLIASGPPRELFSRFWPHLSGMALVLLIVR